MKRRSPAQGQPIEILLVEDNPDHAELIQLALSGGASPPCKIQLMRDGQEALDHLKTMENGTSPEVPLPAVILLDLNLPKVSGFQVLKHIKSHPRLRSIPVSILTTSANEQDVQQAYQDGANCYLSKPARYTDMVVKLHQLIDFLLKISQSPHHPGVQLSDSGS